MFKKIQLLSELLLDVVIEGIDKFEGCHKNVMSKSKECHIDEMKTNIELLNNS